MKKLSLALITLSAAAVAVRADTLVIKGSDTLGAKLVPQLAEEFWRAVSSSGGFNLHVLCHYGRNTHHIIEAIFKACARALRQAVEADPRMSGIPSTKGVL